MANESQVIQIGTIDLHGMTNDDDKTPPATGCPQASASQADGR